MSTFNDTIRAAIQSRLDAGESLHAIAAAAGYSDHSQLSRFMRQERGLATGPKLDGLLRVLGLSIQAKKAKIWQP
jgi:AraC-like DNA-binding protein